MTDKRPGAIINVRMGVYEDYPEHICHGWIHGHVCAVPGCGLLLDCHGAPMPDDYDGVPRAYWSCQLSGPAPLCTDHEGLEPCEYCGEYGHDEDHCPEAASTEAGCAWSRADHEEHEADAANQRERDSR